MTTETLKPCPFCGGRAALSTFKKRIGTACKHTVIRQHAVCKVCSAQTRVFKALDRAPRAWNRRQTDADRIEALTAENERLREGLNAIIDRGVERDQKWMGMNARDIARTALEKQP